MGPPRRYRALRGNTPFSVPFSFCGVFDPRAGIRSSVFGLWAQKTYRWHLQTEKEWEKMGEKAPSSRAAEPVLLSSALFMPSGSSLF